MKLNEICNGNLEQQIRAGLARLAEVAPPGGTPRLFISASDDFNSYVNAEIIGREGFATYGCNSIPEAIEQVVDNITNPKIAEKRRRELQDKIARLQTELDAIPAPLSIVRDEPATVGA